MSILKLLEERHVVSFFVEPNDTTKVHVGEECDMYYSEELSKEQLGELIRELTKLHNTMTEIVA